jgi:hypothetical protein
LEEARKVGVKVLEPFEIGGLQHDFLRAIFCGVACGAQFILNGLRIEDAILALSQNAANRRWAHSIHTHNSNIITRDRRLALPVISSRMVTDREGVPRNLAKKADV